MTLLRFCSIEGLGHGESQTLGPIPIVVDRGHPAGPGQTFHRIAMNQHMAGPHQGMNHFEPEACPSLGWNHMNRRILDQSVQGRIIGGVHPLQSGHCLHLANQGAWGLGARNNPRKFRALSGQSQHILNSLLVVRYIQPTMVQDKGRGYLLPPCYRPDCGGSQTNKGRHIKGVQSFVLVQTGFQRAKAQNPRQRLMSSRMGDPTLQATPAK